MDVCLELVFYEAISREDLETIYNVWKLSLVNKELYNAIKTMLSDNWKVVCETANRDVSTTDLQELITIYDKHRIKTLLTFGFSQGDFSTVIGLMRESVWLTKLTVKTLASLDLLLEHHKPPCMDKSFVHFLYQILILQKEFYIPKVSYRRKRGSTPLKARTIHEELISLLIKDMDKEAGNDVKGVIFFLLHNYEAKFLVMRLFFKLVKIIEKDNTRTCQVAKVIFGPRIEGKALVQLARKGCLVGNLLFRILKDGCWEELTEGSTSARAELPCNYVERICLERRFQVEERLKNGDYKTELAEFLGITLARGNLWYVSGLIPESHFKHMVWNAWQYYKRHK